MSPELISLLSKLEPILGITFALNLAYIGLPRFRYRSDIRTYVKSKLEDIKDIPEQHCDTDWYKQVLRLANLKNNHASLRPGEVEKMPSENWSHAYVAIYERHRDRHVVCSFAFACAILLFFGVAHELGFFVFSMSPFSAAYIAWWFSLCAIMAATPVTLVLVGNWVVRKAHTFAERNIRDLKKTFQQEVHKAKLDVSIENKELAAQPAE